MRAIDDKTYTLGERAEKAAEATHRKPRRAGLDPVRNKRRPLGEPAEKPEQHMHI